MYVAVTSLYVEMYGALIDFRLWLWLMELTMNQLRVMSMNL